MSGVLQLFKQEALKATYPLVTDNLQGYLVRLSAVTSSHVKAITGATNATPIVLTITANAWANNDIITVSGVLGNTAANGRWRVSAQATNTVTLLDPITGANSVGNGAYVSGGYAINLTTIQFLSAIDVAARVAVSANLASKTFVLGVFSFSAFTWSAVASGLPCQAVMVVDVTPATDATRPIIAVDDGATNLPVTPNGGDITYTPNASGMFAL
jgi:hypothetical protein